VWALVETAFWFPSSGGRRSSVHGCGSVHAVVELRKDVRELHHLTGHYLESDFKTRYDRPPQQTVSGESSRESSLRMLAASIAASRDLSVPIRTTYVVGRWPLSAIGRQEDSAEWRLKSFQASLESQ
jgi:hypothetical protein